MKKKKKKDYIQQGICRLERLETLKEFMAAELANGGRDLSYRAVYDQAVACWEILCENEGDG